MRNPDTGDPTFFGDETIANLGAKVGLAPAPAAIVIGTLAKMALSACDTSRGCI